MAVFQHGSGAHDQDFGPSSESRLVAQLPGMVQQKFDKKTMVLVFMVVILALVFWILRIAGKFAKELAREESCVGTIMEEVPAPPLFVAPPRESVSA